MSPAADSAGHPFAGRSFQPNPFEGDTGEADPAVATALHSFAEVRSTAHPDAIEQAFAELISALQPARLLIPLVAEAGDYGVTESGRVVEKSQELSIVHVEGPDGRAVAPVFSSVESLRVWNKDARPVPVAAARAALATAAEGLALLVLDPGSPHSVTLRRSALQAIATGEAYQSPLREKAVLDALAEGLEDFRSQVLSYELHSGDPSRTMSGPEIIVALGLVPGLNPDDLGAMLAAISAAWTSHPVLHQRVDGLGMKILPA